MNEDFLSPGRNLNASDVGASKMPRPGAYASDWISTASTEPIPNIDLPCRYNPRMTLHQPMAAAIVLSAICSLTIGNQLLFASILTVGFGAANIVSLLACGLLVYHYAKFRAHLIGTVARAEIQENITRYAWTGSALIAILAMGYLAIAYVIFPLMYLPVVWCLFNVKKALRVFRDWCNYGRGGIPSGCFQPQIHWFARVLMLVLMTTLASVTLGLFTLPVLFSVVTYSAFQVENFFYGERCQRWRGTVERMGRSASKQVREAILLGFTYTQGVPVIKSRDTLFSHVLVIGATEAGKSSLVLLTLKHQVLKFPDFSTVTFDLKADTNELWAEARINANGRDVFLFHNIIGKPTHTINLFKQNFWKLLTPNKKAELLLTCLNLDYGADYAKNFYSGVNSDLLTRIFEEYDPESFGALLRLVENAIRGRGLKLKLPQKQREACLQLALILKRLASVDLLNEGAPTIQLSDTFRRPTHLHFHLTSKFGTASEADVVRLVMNLLPPARSMVADQEALGTVIFADEYQVAAGRNMEWLFRTLRSMRIGIVATVQNVADVKTRDNNLESTMRSNCGTTYWLTVNADDAREISRLGGVTLEPFTSTSESSLSSTVTTSFTLYERINGTECNTTSADPMLAFLHLRLDKSFAKFNGLVHRVVLEHHLSQEEFERRRLEPLPDELPNSTIVGSLAKRRYDEQPPEAGCGVPLGPKSPMPSSPADSTITEIVAPKRQRRVRSKHHGPRSGD